MEPLQPHVLIVTPAHNEEERLPDLHRTLTEQTWHRFTWVVVDDGSVDGTRRVLDDLAASSGVQVLDRPNDGGLISGSAFAAWRYGVSTARSGVACTHIMKLDADVRLPPDYLERVLTAMAEDVGIAGGVIMSQGMREQLWHVPGPVKLYTVECYDALCDLPSAVGFDVLDEVAASSAGFSTHVVRTAPFELARAIGASEGGVHGRYRNGRVCRWTGYDVGYFLLHALRYAVRRPYVVGAGAMLLGYSRAGQGPFPKLLKQHHSRLQRAKLRQAAEDPAAWFRRTYVLFG